MKAKDNGFKQVQIAYLTVISYLDIDTTNFHVIRVQRVNTKASLMVEFFNSFSWTSYYHSVTEVHEERRRSLPSPMIKQKAL